MTILRTGTRMSVTTATTLSSTDTVRAIEPLCAGADVLEVGCGTGLILKRVAPVARRAVGLDISPNMLERARERG